MTKSCVSPCNLWYLDDGCLGGSHEEVLSDLDKIIAAGDSLGLHIKPSKCELFFISPDGSRGNVHQEALEAFRQRAPEIKVLKEEDLTLLGAPITEKALEGVMIKKLQDLERMSDRLQLLDSHDALYILRHSLAIPKVNFFLRGAPCHKIPEVLDRYDQVLRASLEKILNIKMVQEDSWTQSTLPVARGGLGIRSIKDIALPAFISSAYGTTGATRRLLPEYITLPDYQELVEAEEEWWTRVGSNDDLQILNKAMQSEWDKPLAESIYQGLLEKQTAPVEKARLIAVASEHSSDWMNALPIKGSELKLDDTSLRIAVGLRLGLKVVAP